MSQTFQTFQTTDFLHQALTEGLNGNLDALRTAFSGASAPTSPVAYQLWADTANKLLKMRDSTNTSWWTIGPLGPLQQVQTLIHAQTALAAGYAELALPHPFLVTGVVLVPDTTTLTSVATTKEWTFALKNQTTGNQLFSATPSTATSVSGVTVEASTELQANTKYRLTANQNQSLAAWDVLRFTIAQVGAPTAVTKCGVKLYGYPVGV